MWLPIMETKMDANMVANIETNSTNLRIEMSTIMVRLTIQIEESEKVLKEQSSRQLSSDTKNNDIWGE